MRLFDKPINVTNWENPAPMPLSREELFDDWLRNQPAYSMLSTPVRELLLEAFQYGVKIGEGDSSNDT